MRIRRGLVPFSYRFAFAGNQLQQGICRKAMIAFAMLHDVKCAFGQIEKNVMKQSGLDA